MASPAYIDPATGALTDGEAWVALATTTLGSDTATITFTSTDDGAVGDWSQYMHLCLISSYQFSYDGGPSWGPLLTWLNGNTTYADYAVQRFYGSGSAANAAYTTGPANGYGTAAESGVTDNMFAAFILDLFDINSGKYKYAIGRNASDRDGAGDIYCNGWYFKSQAPVTSITINASVDGYREDSMFSLFGILPRMVA